MGAAGAPAGLLLLVRWSDQTMRRDPGLSMRKYHRKNGRIGLDRGLLDHLREVPVHGRVVGELGVKRGYDHAALAGHHAFSPGHDEASDLVELPRQPDLDRLETEPVERLAVQVEVALEGEHADDHAVARSPRTTSRASAAGRTP